MNKRKIKKAIKRLRYLPKGKYFFLYAFNKVRHYYLKITKSTKVAYPSTVMLELTNQCNLACTTCPRVYAYGKEMSKGYMDIDTAKRVIDELWPYLDSIGLTGMGETFMYKDIAEIVKYIKQKNKGIIISVSTNAVLPDFINAVSQVIGLIDTIQVSIDGLNSVYESIRIKSNFKLLDQNLHKLVQLARNTETVIMLNMVVVKENYTDMPQLIDYAKQIGVRYLDFSLFNVAAVTTVDISYYEFYQTPEFKNALAKLENKIKNTPEIIVTERNFNTQGSFQKCIFPWSHFYITWNGFMTPCCAKPFPKELNFGNVSDTNVMSILNSKSYLNFRQSWYQNSHPAFCEKCHFIHITPVNKNTKMNLYEQN